MTLNSQSGWAAPLDLYGFAVKPYLTSECFDLHNRSDIARRSDWIRRKQVPMPNFYAA